MIQTKYLIIIGAIICLLVLYYICDEISNVKKIFVPVYQKTMILEAKMLKLEKIPCDQFPKKKLTNSKIESPALSITYQSDMVKNGNLSVKYADLSETEANELLKHINQNKTKQLTNQIPNQNQQIQQQNNKKISNIKSGEISDFGTPIEKINNNNNIFNEETDTINIKFTDLLKKPTEIIDLENNKPNTIEHQKLLNGSALNHKNIYSDDVFDNNNELDQDVIKSISDSIQCANIHSDNTLSDIPVLQTNKIKTGNIDKKITKENKNNKKIQTKKQNKKC